MADVERWMGAKTDLPSILDEDINRKPPWYYPAQFHMTTFAGMADHMQQMWGGLPADVATEKNTEATDANTQALQDLKDTLGGSGAGQLLGEMMGVLP